MNTHAVRSAWRSLGMLVACVCMASADGTAQTEKIQLRLVPQPDQWIQFHMVQEIATSPAERAADAVMPDLMVKLVATFTQTTGHPDPDGRVRAELTYDELSATTTTAGQTTPVELPSSLLGQQMIATYDAQGKLVDIQAPSGMPANVVARVRDMMTSAFSGLGSSSFAVGETVSTPINMTLPSPTDAGPALTGTMTMTLRSISEEGGERLAHFDQKMQLSMESTRQLPVSGSRTASTTMTMNMKMVGAGTMDYNVNRGFMVANRMQSTIDTASSVDKPLPKGMPTFDMHMIVKLSIDATY
jgi:hypothetical protein